MAEQAESGGIPEFFSSAMNRNEMYPICDRAMVVYEAGTGGEHRTVVGAIIEPNTDQEQQLPGMLWILPSKTADGQPAQSEEQVSLLQINRRFIIEVGSLVTPKDLP